MSDIVAEDRADRVVILTALAEVMGEVEFLSKDDQNPHFRYSYVSEAHALEKLRPALLKAGLFLIPSVDECEITGDDRTHVAINYQLAHASGAVWPELITFRGCGKDAQDKGVAKATTMANKYMLFKLFQLPTVEDEPDASVPVSTITATYQHPPPLQTRVAPPPFAPPPPPSPARTQNDPTPVGGKLTAGHLKTNGVWKRAFAAAEAVGAPKFSALDWATHELGATRWEDLSVDRIPELLTQIDRFPDFYVSQEPPPPDDEIPF